jgi:predicted PhzF superfamily epimerase YddE/YHI9
VKLQFKQVDVFTKVPFQGNPVAVVIGAEGLDTATMQRIANWTNLSETTFLLKSAVADYKLRIFTPRMELPFAGHPTIGSAHAAIESGFIQAKGRFRQECGAGILDLTNEQGRLFVKGPAWRMEPVEPIPGIAAANPRRVHIGPVWVVAEMRDARALAELRPDMDALARWTEKIGAGGLTLYAPSDDCVAAIHVRSFAPAHGIPEDPVCGSGNLSVAAYLKHSNLLASYGSDYVARQGAQCGRDGRVYMRVEGDALYLGGDAVTCVDGTVSL